MFYFTDKVCAKCSILESSLKKAVLACNVNFNLVMFSIIYFFKNYTTNAILYWMAVFNSVAFFH